jgi:hypothetical protein
VFSSYFGVVNAVFHMCLMEMSSKMLKEPMECQVVYVICFLKMSSFK